MHILPLLHCLHSCVPPTTVRHLSCIIAGLLVMTGRVTMRGIARWTPHGGSYRTVQRWFATAIPWPDVQWQFVRHHLLQPDDVYLLAGDEVVVTKAGKKTFGLDRFFSSVQQRPVAGLAFFALALVSTKTRRALPLRLEQVIRTPAEKAAAHAQAATKRARATAPKRKPGRPKGSVNQPKAEPCLSPELQRLKTLLQAQRQLMGAVVPLVYLALDGHFGNSPTLTVVQQGGLHLISKLRADAALYLPYTGPYQGRGPRRKYGAKLDYRGLPPQYLRQTTVEDQIQTRTYQLEGLHKGFGQPLNIVILVKTNLTTHKQAHAILFSSDRTLGWATLIDYYSLRFQIEFTFRDAKQYWGLEDFMNVTATAVTNAANLALFMVNLVSVLLHEFRQRDPHGGVLDLKAYWRGHKYVTETLKLLPEMPDAIIIEQIYRQVARLGQIHSAEARLNAA